MILKNNILGKLQDKFFNSLVSNRLIYNTCWEDPRIDRELLQIDANSEIVMLTSAGCNALDYLLDNPLQIHCVDANPTQNALLEFKKALFKENDYARLWQFFGRGYDEKAHISYHRDVRRHLSASAKRFWDYHINYFSKTSAEGSFYYHGTSGKIAHMIRKRIMYKNLYGTILDLLNSNTLEEQTYHFQEVENQLWSAFYKWLIKRNATMALLGVPVTQRDMIEQENNGGLFSFIEKSLRHVFTERPIEDNYFWRVYLTGSYSQACCPNYLKSDHFLEIRNQINKVKLHDSYLNNFLKKNPGSYTHYVLLDHQDWLANSNPDLLAEEWKNILKNSIPGTKILFRSAGTESAFLPDFVNERVRFHKDKTEQLHSLDRVGTYAGTFLAEVIA